MIRHWPLMNTPMVEQASQLEKRLTEVFQDSGRIASEVIPVAMKFLASTSVGTLCLVSRSMAELAPFSTMEIRTSFMFSIIRQLSEYSSAPVRSSVRRDGAILIFDQDGAVHGTALEEFAPAILVLLQATRRV